MKLWHSTFLNHYRTPLVSSSTTLCLCWRVTRQDGLTFGWTEHTDNLVLAGVTYLAAAGLSVSGTQTTDTMAVPTIDVTAFLDVSTEADILAGIWDSAIVTMFEANYADLPGSFDVTRLNILRYGTLGRISIQDNVFQAEIRGLGQALDTHIGSQYTATCPWQLGDAVCSAGGLDIADFTFAGTVSAINLGAAGRLRFSASALAQPAGIFNLGTITFTSGLNAGLPAMDIRTWHNKEFVMQRPLPYAPAVGNTFNAVWGDNKTFHMCRDRFNNAGQFRGFHFLPGIDALLENPVQWRNRPVPIAPPDGNPDNDGSGDSGGSEDGGDSGEGGSDSGE